MTASLLRCDRSAEEVILGGNGFIARWGRLRQGGAGLGDPGAHLFIGAHSLTRIGGFGFRAAARREPIRRIAEGCVTVMRGSGLQCRITCRPLIQRPHCR